MRKRSAPAGRQLRPKFGSNCGQDAPSSGHNLTATPHFRHHLGATVSETKRIPIRDHRHIFAMISESCVFSAGNVAVAAIFLAVRGPRRLRSTGLYHRDVPPIHSIAFPNRAEKRRRPMPGAAPCSFSVVFAKIPFGRSAASAAAIKPACARASRAAVPWRRRGFHRSKQEQAHPPELRRSAAQSRPDPPRGRSDQPVSAGGRYR